MIPRTQDKTGDTVCNEVVSATHRLSFWSLQLNAIRMEDGRDLTDHAPSWPRLHTVVLALGHRLVLSRIDLLPGLVERLVRRRVAGRQRVRILRKQHEHGGDGAINDRHNHVGDGVANEEAAEAERSLRVGDVDSPLGVAVDHSAHTSSRSHETHDDLAEEQHVHDERVVGDGGPALGGEELPNALTRRREAIAVDTHVRVRKAVEVLHPRLDAPDQAPKTAQQTRGHGVALVREGLLEGAQDHADRLDDGHDERAEADRAERQRQRTTQGTRRRQRTAVLARVVPPTGDRACRGDHDDVTAHERSPEEDDQHSDQDAEFLACRVLDALFDVLPVVDGGVRRDNPHERPHDLQQREEDGRQHDDRVAEHGLGGHLQVGGRERDARADAAHVEQHEHGEERAHGHRPPVHRVALLVQEGRGHEARAHGDGADGDDRQPDEHLAAHEHDERPEQRRHQGAAGDHGADLGRVLVLGALLLDVVLHLLDLLLVGRAREHVLAVRDGQAHREHEHREEEHGEQDVVAALLRLGLRRQHGLAGLAVGVRLELLLVVLLLLLRHGFRLSGGANAAIESCRESRRRSVLKPRPDISRADPLSGSTTLAYAL